MLKFNDWCKKDKEDKGYTLTKSSSGLPLFVLDNPLDKDDDIKGWLKAIGRFYVRKTDGIDYVGSGMIYDVWKDPKTGE